MGDYKNSKAAKNEAVGKAGRIEGYSNGLPGLIKRIEGIGSRLTEIETHIGNMENLQPEDVADIVSSIHEIWDKVDIITLEFTPVPASADNALKVLAQELIDLIASNTFSSREVRFINALQTNGPFWNCLLFKYSSNYGWALVSYYGSPESTAIVSIKNKVPYIYYLLKDVEHSRVVWENANYNVAFGTRTIQITGIDDIYIPLKKVLVHFYLSTSTTRKITSEVLLEDNGIAYYPFINGYYTRSFNFLKSGANFTVTFGSGERFASEGSAVQDNVLIPARITVIY